MAEDTSAEPGQAPPPGPAPVPGSQPTGLQGAGSQSAGPQPAGPQGAGPQGAGPQGAGPASAGAESAGPEPAGPQGAGPQGAGGTVAPRELRGATASGQVAWARSPARRRAVGIYGTIVTAAILAAGGDELSAPDLAISVLITLVVYWVAEEYAEILGESVTGSRLPTWRYALAALAATWPMVSASAIPLLLLLVSWLLGASGYAAANVALVAAVAELMFYAWRAGHGAHLPRRQQIGMTAAAAVLGLVMILLKDVVLISLH